MLCVVIFFSRVYPLDRHNFILFIFEGNTVCANAKLAKNWQKVNRLIWKRKAEERSSVENCSITVITVVLRPRLGMHFSDDIYKILFSFFRGIDGVTIYFERKKRNLFKRKRNERFGISDRNLSFLLRLNKVISNWRGHYNVIRTSGLRGSSCVWWSFH